jgi:hypothetical protein
MLMTENAVAPGKLQSILNFDGLPITADFITENIQARLGNDYQTSPQDSKGGKA